MCQTAALPTSGAADSVSNENSNKFAWAPDASGLIFDSYSSSGESRPGGAGIRLHARGSIFGRMDTARCLHVDVFPRSAEEIAGSPQSHEPRKPRSASQGELHARKPRSYKAVREVTKPSCPPKLSYPPKPGQGNTTTKRKSPPKLKWAFLTPCAARKLQLRHVAYRSLPHLSRTVPAYVEHKDGYLNHENICAANSAPHRPSRTAGQRVRFHHGSGCWSQEQFRLTCSRIAIIRNDRCCTDTYHVRLFTPPQLPEAFEAMGAKTRYGAFRKIHPDLRHSHLTSASSHSANSIRLSFPRGKDRVEALGPACPRADSIQDEP